MVPYFAEDEGFEPSGRAFTARALAVRCLYHSANLPGAGAGPREQRIIPHRQRCLQGRLGYFYFSHLLGNVNPISSIMAATRRSGSSFAVCATTRSSSSLTSWCLSIAAAAGIASVSPRKPGKAEQPL